MNTKYKLIVCDFDGTLCNDKKEVSARTQNAIKAFTGSGGKFAICTTRPLRGISDIAKKYGLSGEIITGQGSSIASIDDGTQIYKSFLSQEETQEIVSYLSKYSSYIFIANDYDIIGNGHKFFESLFQPNTGAPIVKTTTNIVEDCLKRETAQIIVGSYFVTKIKWLTKVTEKHFGKRFNVGMCDRHVLNIVQKGVSKGTGIAQLASIYGIEREEIISFGDSDNDKSMFEYSGVGVAMGNAMDGLKAYADFICPDNNADGVAVYLEKNVL